MKELLDHIVKSIVDNVDEVELEETTNELGEIVLRLKVDQSDMGKLIGKDGQIIKAIRTIIRVPAIKQGKRVNIEIIEEGKEKAAAEEQSVEETEEA
ncbi:MAG: KH domain-containing protein [Patescibacteria group bacterium]|nr:KH domain-containing protein [Patescibacteria group bacterium]